MIVILPFKDKFLAFQIHNNFLMSSNLSSNFRLNISFVFLKNHIPKVLKQPFLTLILDKQDGFLGCSVALLPIGIISVLSKLSCKPELFKNA